MPNTPPIIRAALAGAALAAALIWLSLYEPPNIDQCRRREIFALCINAAPAAERPTGQWYQVVLACETAALHQSATARQFITPECRP